MLEVQTNTNIYREGANLEEAIESPEERKPDVGRAAAERDAHDGSGRKASGEQQAWGGGGAEDAGEALGEGVRDG